MFKIKLFFLLLLLSSCNQNETLIDEDGDLFIEEKLDNEVIKRTVYSQNNKVQSIEYEDTKNKSVRISYFDENGDIFQKLSCPFENGSPLNYIENYVYKNSKLKNKILKNNSTSKLYNVEFDDRGKVKRIDYYMENNRNTYSHVIYDISGKIDNEKSKFLYLSMEDSVIKITPIGVKKSKFTMCIVEQYDNPNLDNNLIDKTYHRKGNSIYFDLRDFEIKNNLTLVLHIQDDLIDNIPNFSVFKLYIDDFSNIPKTNLQPVFLINGKYQTKRVDRQG